MVETQLLAMFGGEVRSGAKPANAAGGRWGLGRNEGGGGSITKKAGTDEHAGIVIEKRGGGADFHADDEHVAGLA